MTFGEASSLDAGLKIAENDDGSVYRAILESADQGFCTIEVAFDENERPVDYRFLEVSPAFERLTGIENGAGRWMREIAPDQDQFWFDTYGRVALSGKSERFENFSTPLDRWFSVYAMKITGAARVAVLFDDISDRKRAEAALSASEQSQSFLLKLSDALRQLTVPSEIAQLAADRLGKQFGMSRVFFATIQGSRMVVEHDFTQGVDSIAGEHDLTSLGPELLGAYRDGAVITVKDVGTDPRFNEQARSGLRARQVGAYVDIVLFEEDRSVSLLAVQSATPRAWTLAEENVFQEVAERARSALVRTRAEAAVRASREQFESLFNQAPMGVYLVDGDFVIRQVNPIALPVFGDIPGGAVGRDFAEVIHILWDEEYADEIVRIFRHTLETGEPYVTPERAEYRVDRDTIEYYEWRLDRISLPGDQYGVVCYFRDISAQVYARLEIEKGHEFARESERRQGLLLAELQHRVRNILAMVRSVVRRTEDSYLDVDDYVRHLDGRLSSLARVQAVLTREAGRGVDLYTMVLDELTSQGAMSTQYEIDGPQVELSPKAAEVLGLAVHELATNSTKYGLLAETTGVIQICWTLDERGGRSWLCLTWNEPVDSGRDRAERTGFGTDLIVNRVPYELRGAGHLLIGKEGVEARIDFPLTDGPSKLELVASNRV